MPRGVPQIEISYDLDANGILTVAASEKSTGKSENITVTNDKGRLSKEDIDKMLEEAERFKDDDEKAKQLIETRNNFENQIYQFKSTLNDEKIASVIDDSMKEELNNVIQENVLWLENNQLASKEDYDSKLSEFQQAMKPLQEKMMANMPQGFPGEMPQGFPEDLPKSKPNDETTHGGPKIEEVD